MNKQLLKLTVLVEDLDSIVQDYLTLKETNNKRESVLDNDDLVSCLSQTSNAIKYIDLLLLEDIDTTTAHDISKVSKNFGTFTTLLKKYQASLDQIDSSGSSLSPYSISNLKSPKAFEELKSASEKSVLNTIRPIDSISQSNAAKSVRFKSTLVELSPSSLHKPYQDNPESLFETAEIHEAEDDGPMNLNNKQVFIHNQQQMIQQDNQLDELHTSVKRQHAISLEINNEVGDQMVILGDLENGVERSNTRLIRSTDRLKKFRESMRQHKDWWTIFILIVVLLLLLIVLK